MTGSTVVSLPMVLCRYSEYHRCITVEGKSEDDPECKFYQRAYRSMCPSEWVERWNEQRETGTWAGKY